LRQPAAAGWDRAVRRRDLADRRRALRGGGDAQALPRCAARVVRPARRLLRHSTRAAPRAAVEPDARRTRAHPLAARPRRRNVGALAHRGRLSLVPRAAHDLRVRLRAVDDAERARQAGAARVLPRAPLELGAYARRALPAAGGGVRLAGQQRARRRLADNRERLTAPTAGPDPA